MSATHHTVDPKFTYRDKRSGKDVVLYIGLLDAAHRAGLVYIGTEILAYPCEENNQTCIVKATATFQRGEIGPLVFNAIGDANPRNVGANIAPHFIRMAETRAKARALRDALNVGMVTVEELGTDDDEQTPPARQSRTPQPPASPTTRPAAGPPVGGPPLAVVEDALSDADFAQTPEGAMHYLEHAKTKEDADLWRAKCRQLGVDSREFGPVYNAVTDRIKRATAPVPAGYAG